MALGDVIARLSVVLGIDTAAFEKGLTVAEKRMAATQKQLGKISDKLTGIGKSLSIGITAPVAAAGFAVVKMTGDFEAAMNKVSISTQGTSAELKQMSDLALKLGKDTIFGATDAADAMDMLAKNGLNAKQILDGAATAAVNLATAGGSELAPAADAITDVMQQFKVKTSELPAVVDQITGAVNQSKLDFNDFALAIGQAGGVAGGVGVDFRDFNAALAGTSSLFASGSDAGTSFKTFLTSLPGKSSTARAAIQNLGLQFYNADGSLRSMSEIAEELQTKLSGLSDVAKQQALTEIFGTDAMRTAIGLMDLGAKGLDDIKAKIAETDAAAQSAKRLEGFNGQLENLKGATETLAIRIGQSGVLEAITGLVTRLADFIDVLSETNPSILKFVAVFATIAAAVGPVLIGFGAVANSIGVLLPLLVKLGPVLSVIRVAMLAIAANPVILALAAVIGGIYLAWANWDKIEPILRRLWEGVKKYVGEGLKRVLEAVLAPIRAVKSAFYDLYDAVVGHSYVPDMVDGIAAQMKRLDAVMVAPAKTATGKVSEAMRDMATQSQQLLDRLFPEIRRMLDYQKDLALLDKMDLSAAEKEEGRHRAFSLFAGVSPYGPGKVEVGAATVSDVAEAARRSAEKLTPVLDKMSGVAKRTAQETADSFKRLADDTLAALDRLAYGIKNGGFLGILSGILGAGVQLGRLGLFGKSVATKLGGYASGTSSARSGLALVGERGPELVNFSGGERVWNARDSVAMARGGRQTVEIVDTTGLFRFAVNGQIMESAPGIASAGAQGGVARMAYKNTRRWR